MTTPIHRSGGLAALLVALLVAACGSSTTTPVPSASAEATSAAPTAVATPATSDAPSASADPVTASCDPSTTPTGATPAPDTNDPNAATYTEIEQQVVAIRGLETKAPVARGVFDKPGLCAYIAGSFERDNPESLITGTQDLFKALLLMPREDNLQDLYIQLLTSQVAGLYDDETKTMYVVTSTGEIGPTEEITYAHEYTHALQDQHFGLRSVVGEAKDQSDRTLARTALVEGDATLLMSLWAQQHLTPQELGEVASASDPASQAVLDKMPPILKETLLWPYTQGLQLALRGFQANGYAGVDALFANPPDSTEQLLHPEKFDAREQPVAVAFPADFPASLGAGWTIALQDTIGEYQLSVMLGDPAAADAEAPADAAAGWGGDRVAWVTGPDGKDAAVLDTAWDTDADGAEFAKAVEGWVANLKAAGRSAAVLQPAPDRVVLISASDDDTLARIANVLGLAG